MNNRLRNYIPLMMSGSGSYLILRLMKQQKLKTIKEEKEKEDVQIERFLLPYRIQLPYNIYKKNLAEGKPIVNTYIFLTIMMTVATFFIFKKVAYKYKLLL